MTMQTIPADQPMKARPVMDFMDRHQRFIGAFALLLAAWVGYDAWHASANTPAFERSMECVATQFAQNGFQVTFRDDKMNAGLNFNKGSVTGYRSDVGEVTISLSQDTVPSYTTANPDAPALISLGTAIKKNCMGNGSAISGGPNG